MPENKKTGIMLAQFFRYIRDELSGKERNSFERELQKDPFAEEALEGFSSIGEQEATDDITILNAKLKKRITRKSTLALYRIAGIVALLLAVSAVLVLTFIKKPDNQLAINAPASESLEIIKNQPIIVSDSKENALSESDREEKKSLTEYDKIATKGARKNTDTVEKPGEISNDAMVSEPKAIISKEEVSGELAPTAPIAAMARKQATKADTQVQNEIKKSDTSLDEIVVVGYGANKSNIKESEDISGYVHPQPVTGKSEFDEYVKNNLHRPDTADGGKKVAVVISFLVRTTGQIDSIRIIKSPGKAYSDEAIRVIEEGPEWKPAKDNGKPVEEVVRLRFVFR